MLETGWSEFAVVMASQLLLVFAFGWAVGLVLWFFKRVTDFF